MANIKLTFKEDAISAIKKAVGGGKESMRTVYVELEKAKAAFNAAKAIAEAEGVAAFAQADELLTGEGMLPVVAVVGVRERNEKTGKFDSGIRSVIMFAMPTANAFIGHNETSQAWVEKIIEKEAAHVFFRRLRNADSAESLSAAFDGSPHDVDTYVAEYVGEGLDTDAFDAIWPGFRKLLTEKLPALVKLLPGKGEVLKAIRSKIYAEGDAELSPLEAQGIFKFIAESMIKAGQSATNAAGELDPIDTSSIESWLAERDTFTYREAPKAEKDFSVLSGLNLGILAAPAAASVEPTGDASASDTGDQLSTDAEADATESDKPNKAGKTGK